MDRAQLSRQLAQLHPTLSALNEPYCIIGSAALLLSGVAIGECDDIDILTTSLGAAHLQREWSTWLHSQHHAQGHDGFRSAYSLYRFGLGTVEVMGDLQVQRDGIWQAVTVHDTQQIEGIVLATIQEQRRLLTWFGRKKDLARLTLLQQATEH